MRACTSFQSHTVEVIEVRPNSHPERTGKHMTCTLSDGTVVNAANVDAALGCDIGPDTDRESSIERLITRRARRLMDARENLKVRLNSYIELRSVQRWNPPKHMTYLAFADRLKSFASWPRRTKLPTPESLAEAGFYYEGMYKLFYITFNTLFRHFSRTTIFTLFVTQGVQMSVPAFTAKLDYAIGFPQMFPLKNMLAGHRPVSTCALLRVQRTFVNGAEMHGGTNVEI